MEGHYIVKALIRRNDWMVEVNLNDAFFMVPITTQFRHLLLFGMKKMTYTSLIVSFLACAQPQEYSQTYSSQPWIFGALICF